MRLQLTPLRRQTLPLFCKFRHERFLKISNLHKSGIAVMSANSSQEAPSDLQESHGTSTQPAKRARVASLQAAHQTQREVYELEKPLQDYMTLPASQYSVLDAKRIERIDGDTFKCYVGGLKFFNFELEPVITVSVTVGERGPTVRLLSTELRGSKAAEEANARFSATMCNSVTWIETEAEDTKRIASDVSICVMLDLPGWFIVPTKAVESTGSAVLKRLLTVAVPRFLAQLEADYKAWSCGDDSRKPVEGNEKPL